VAVIALSSLLFATAQASSIRIQGVLIRSGTPV